MLEKNPDTVKIVFKNFPLRNHKMAVPAATAALAAQEQGKFWEFHDLIFAESNLNALTIEKFEGMAQKLDLDLAKFKKDVQGPATIQKIRADFNEARRIGVDSTPTVFVGGRKLKKNRTIENIQALIDKALEGSKNN